MYASVLALALLSLSLFCWVSPLEGGTGTIIVETELSRTYLAKRCRSWTLDEASHLGNEGKCLYWFVVVVVVMKSSSLLLPTLHLHYAI